MQTFLSIEPGNRAAAGADFHDVDDGRLDGKTLHIAASVIDRFHTEPTIFNQRALCSRSTHVEGDNIREAQRFRIRAGANAASNRTRFHKRNGLAACAINRQEPAVRSHHEQ